MSDKYQEALQQAQEELATIEERRSALIRLIQNIMALSGEEGPGLTPPPGYVPEGLTPEIKKILGLTTVHMTPVQIRDSLIQRGFAHSSPKNLLISVHTALGRIEEELEVITQTDGKKAYKMPASTGVADFLRRLAEGQAAIEKAAAVRRHQGFKDLEKALAKGQKQ